MAGRKARIVRRDSPSNDMAERKIIGGRIVRFRIVDSTNEKARELLDESPEEGTVIVADRQAAGRGRHGRAWSSPPGGLYLSIILTPPEKNVHLLSLLSGLPTRRAMKPFGVDAALKWPNDLNVGGKKIGGILCEGIHRRDEFRAIVGIGVNTAVEIRALSADVRTEATTLKHEAGREIDNDEFLEGLLNEYDAFYAGYEAGNIGPLLAEYRATCSTLGRRVVIETAKGRVRGTARDVNDLGALVVEERGRRHEVFEGTVQRIE